MAASTSDNVEMTTKFVDTLTLPMAASVQIWAYTLVCVNASGYVQMAADTAGLLLIGYSITPGANANNTAGANGALNINVRPIGNAPEDAYFLMNTSTTATQAWVGTAVYFVDNNTVAQSSGVVNNVKMGNCVLLYTNGQILVHAAGL